MIVIKVIIIALHWHWFMTIINVGYDTAYYNLLLLHKHVHYIQYTHTQRILLHAL